MPGICKDRQTLDNVQSKPHTPATHPPRPTSRPPGPSPVRPTGLNPISNQILKKKNQLPQALVASHSTHTPRPHTKVVHTETSHYIPLSLSLSLFLSPSPDLVMRVVSPSPSAAAALRCLCRNQHKSTRDTGQNTLFSISHRLVNLGVW